MFPPALLRYELLPRVCIGYVCCLHGDCPDLSPVFFACATRRCSQDKEVAVVVSFLEIYCDRVRDLGEAFMSNGDEHGLRTTSDVHQKLKSVRIGDSHSAREVKPGLAKMATRLPANFA